MKKIRSLAISAAMLFSLPALASEHGNYAQLSSDHHEIALRVAGKGFPDCRSYLLDGTVRPCFPAFVVKRGGRINAWSLGGVITLSEGAVQRLNRDEFAILVGHEIAHWYLGHKASSPQAELEADKLGLLLACDAGFDIQVGLGLFRHLRTSRSHGNAVTRLEAVRLASCAQSGMTENHTISAVSFVDTHIPLASAV